MSLAAAKTEPSAHGRIPVLDIGAYLAGEAGAAAPLARAIARTCEDTGFLVVANHGVPQQLVDDTFAVAQQFFARPEPDKLALKIGKYNIGYLPFGGQVVRHSPVNKNTRPNFSESFYITRDRAPDHPDIVNNKPLVGLNRWPEDMPEFRAATTAYYRAMEAMTTRLVPLFALALDLPADYFAAAFAEPNCTIRLIHYPPHPSPEDNEFGFAPHTDNNFITFLAQSKLPGLEVRTAEGDWIRPPAVPGTFVVNTGAMLARYSNDRFRATPHRVINRNDRSRYACPFFLGPNHDVVVEPVPSCVGPDNPPKYEPTTYGAFTQHLLTLNFAHRQAAAAASTRGKLNDGQAGAGSAVLRWRRRSARFMTPATTIRGRMPTLRRPSTRCSRPPAANEAPAPTHAMTNSAVPWTRPRSSGRCDAVIWVVPAM